MSNVPMKTAKTRLFVNGWCDFTVLKLLVDMETADYQNRLCSKNVKNLAITASVCGLMARTAAQIQFRYTMPNS